MPGREAHAKCPWGIAEAEGRLVGEGSSHALREARRGRTGQAPRRLSLRGGGKQGGRAAASMLPTLSALPCPTGV